MKEALFKKAPALPETTVNHTYLPSPEDWAETFELALAHSQEPWTGLALWFTNYNFLTRHRSRVNPTSSSTELDSAS
jgi:hypothetical protein